MLPFRALRLWPVHFNSDNRPNLHKGAELSDTRDEKPERHYSSAVMLKVNKVQRQGQYLLHKLVHTLHTFRA